MARKGKMDMVVEKKENGEFGLVMAFEHGGKAHFSFGHQHRLADEFLVAGVCERFRSKVAAAKTSQEAETIAHELAKALHEGHWNAHRNSAGKEDGSLLVRALVQVSGKTAEAVKAFVSGLDKKQQAALRADPDIAKAIASLRPAKPAKGVDTASLKASLGL